MSKAKRKITTSKKARRRPATQKERDALQFEAIKANFDWTNDDWASTWLPHVRVASLLVARDQDQLKATMHEIVATGGVPELLDNLTKTQQHLAALRKLVDVALQRSFLVIERLGYSPDNPPPESRAH